uniref:Ankyrin repeat and SOCS box containing 10 n=1 Tax=Xenopus tropicalis TaxID=8364 RepID=A0A803K6M3_XENTR
MGSQRFPGVVVTRRAEGAALDYWLSLLSGDTVSLQFLLGDPQGHIHPNSVFDTSDVEEWKNYRYNPTALRIWSLTYEEEFTCPLFVTASRGYADCLQLLLREGANVDFAPGGETALHGACENAHTECAKILLRYGANPNAGSQDGAHPLHCCKTPQSFQCAKLLLQYGAHVNCPTEDEEDTPLHVASRLGLWEHVDLFLRYGASVNKRDMKGETPLCAACSAPQSCEALESHFLVCQRLIQAGSDIHARDQDQQNPLHLACKSANPRVVELLLAQGAQVNAMSYSGNTAMQNILQVTAYRLANQPELIVRALLNHGAIRVWPGALIKVLRYCCASPRTVEVLLNTYSHVRVTDEWSEAVPRDVQQKHPDFFQSVFSLREAPRSLQHLCRCCLRSHLEGKLPQLLPHLPLPPKLLGFLQLDFEGVLY